MPRQDDQNAVDPDDELPPSKSALKRQMHELQRLGEALLELNDKQLATIPIADEQLLDALHECQRIRSNSARKRHLQLIGKLMRHLDPQPIAAALASIHQERHTATAEFHDLEALRDAVLNAGVAGIEDIVKRFPTADRQHLRQLVRQHQRELKQNKPPAASRKLFRYLRELQDA